MNNNKSKLMGLVLALALALAASTSSADAYEDMHTDKSSTPEPTTWVMVHNAIDWAFDWEKVYAAAHVDIDQPLSDSTVLVTIRERSSSDVEQIITVACSREFGGCVFNGEDQQN